jgi:hypothetical protein
VCLFVAVTGCARADVSNEAVSAAGQPSTTNSGQVASSSSRACLDQYPASVPFDVGDTPVATPVPTPGVDAALPVGFALDAIVEQCIRAGGEECDPSQFISKEAAICVSQGSGVADADSWTAGLEVRGRDERARLQWLVLGRGPRDAQCCGIGWLFSVDAISGEIVSQTDAQRVCCPT